ncbi:MAG: hypothetical protein V4721_12935 [Bacteroidota bacterium]
MKNQLLAALFIILAFVISCGEPNHYDSHKGQEPDHSQTDSEHDTIQGRAPDSTVVVIDSTNRGIGDTTVGKDH